MSANQHNHQNVESIISNSLINVNENKSTVCPASVTDRSNKILRKKKKEKNNLYTILQL